MRPELLRRRREGASNADPTISVDGSLADFQVVSGTATYKVENGVLVGTTTEGSPNTFLAT